MDAIIIAHKGPIPTWIQSSDPVHYMDPLWNSIALKPVANQRFGDCHRFLVACEDGYRELFEDVRQYEDVFFSITGGFHLHEVYGYDLERTTGKIGQ